MTRKIAIDGIEVGVAEDQLDNLIERFEGKGLEVDDLEGWQTRATHEPYDFDKFIEEAKEHSDKSPPDVIQFGEKAWGAAAPCVKEFFLKHFGILIKSHSAKSKLVNVLCLVSSVQQAVRIKDAWIKAEKSHFNYYEVNVVVKEDREALLEEIREMAAIIEQADLDAIQTELNSLTSVNFRNVPKNSCKIGNSSYDFNRVAY